MDQTGKQCRRDIPDRSDCTGSSGAFGRLCPAEPRLSTGDRGNGHPFKSAWMDCRACCGENPYRYGYHSVLPEPQRVLEIFSLNLLLSAISGVDGWSQEIIFRGYVLFRLDRAHLPVIVQILLSGALFSAIHIGYIREGLGGAIAPMAGTFILGSFLAWSFHAGNRSMRPIVVAHVLIIVVLQPWLALVH